MATVDLSQTVLWAPFIIHEWQLSAMTDDQDAVLTHPHTGMRPNRVDSFVVTRPTDESLIEIDWAPGSDDTTNNTITVRTKIENGANIAGAVIKVWAYFFSAASGGLNPV